MSYRSEDLNIEKVKNANLKILLNVVLKITGNP
jgi:hypothetical protein